MEQQDNIKIIKTKPIVSWWKTTDPTYKVQNWLPKLTDINIINTKTLNEDFINICLREKHRIFLHINITGMGKTQFEPNIPTIKETFFLLKKLIDSGFPQKQILVIVNPILPNDNGLNALKLILKIFTEFRQLRLRFIKFNVLTYTEIDNGKFIIGNKNISSRQSTKAVMQYLTRSSTFWKDYYKLIDSYSAIISVDKGDEAVVGVRELLAFGYRNEWIDEDGIRSKIIDYEKGNKYKPLLNLLSESRTVRCKNRCLLCPNLY